MLDNVARMKEFVERYVPEFMREGKIPGFSIAVVKEGEVVYAEGYGVRDLSRSTPATYDTLYGIGSCTKSFVALAIMQLAEKGKLKLDDPVSEYVPLKIGVEGTTSSPTPPEYLRWRRLLSAYGGAPASTSASPGVQSTTSTGS
jgi:CubicO group peptidase (beta-lactamase class C family)